MNKKQRAAKQRYQREIKNIQRKIRRRQNGLDHGFYYHSEEVVELQIREFEKDLDGAKEKLEQFLFKHDFAEMMKMLNRCRHSSNRHCH